MNPQRRNAAFDLDPGTMLGKYEIVSKLAMGGMAEIYLAKVSGTAGFEKMVVIKRILPTVANDPKFVQMFLDEARLAATLRHPNIADVYEVGEHDGSPFFAMEFVHGQDARTLRAGARNRKEQVPLAIALAIVHGTATALDYAHERCTPDGRNLNLVHRDVSSSNILLSYEGAIKLIDFGIARATSSTHKTNTGTFKGKIPYMSPEQCRGAAVDRRSDLFSLGVVMYELTVGQRPFRGTSDFDIMDRIVYGGAPRPSELVRNYPPELESIVMRLLARHPDDRYQTAEALLHDLDPYIAEHRLYVSAKSLSKYMRTIFADQINAWQTAMDEGGVTIVQQLTRTGNSNSAELVTPPSGFAVVAPLSEQFEAVTPMPPVAQVAQVAPPDERATPAPTIPPIDLKPRRRFGVIAGALFLTLVLAGGGYVGYRYYVEQRDGNAVAATVETPAPPEPVAKPEPKPVAKPAVAEAPPAPPVVPKAEPVATKVEPAAPPPKPSEPPKTVKRPPTPAPPAPVVVKKPEPAQQAQQTQKPKDKPKDPPKDPQKQERTWTSSDGNAGDSPFLPH